MDGYNGLSKKEKIMFSVIDDTMQVLKSMGISSYRVSTPPGYAGIQVNLPNDSQAFFVWTKIDQTDFHFRLARFYGILRVSRPEVSFISPMLKRLTSSLLGA